MSRLFTASFLPVGKAYCTTQKSYFNLIMAHNSLYLLVTVVLSSFSTAQVTDRCPLLNVGNVKCNSEIDIHLAGIPHGKIFLAETSFRGREDDKQENVLQYLMTEAKLVLKDASEIPTNDLDLSHCGLHFLPELVFRNLTRLAYLKISNNYFYRFFYRIFLYLAPGAELYIRNNVIINEQTLYLNQLSILDFSYNKISSAENMVKSGYVDSLNLSHNQIEPWKMLYTFHSDYHGYKNIDLSNNLINEITTEMGRSMDLVTSIDLGGNPINCSRECSLFQLQNWFKSKRTKILLFNATQDLKCTEPSSHTNMSVLDIKLSSRVCENESQKDSGALTGLIIYVYRFELTYIRYMWSMKKHSTTNQQEKDRENCDYDVFVSYSRKDRDWIFDVLVPYLESPTERYWCKWELRMATHRVFEQSFNNFLILLELERVPRNRLPLSLRLLMASRTYLEWPDEGGKHRSIGRHAFWRRLKLALGTPLADMQPAHTAIENSAEGADENSCDSMSDTPENISLLTYRHT
ncbi:hypothetical protein B566_EDAN011589 [Ephemera danica]|nr:hypothetical protein B566_EDAN011589 [Ephemera danica]